MESQPWNEKTIQGEIFQDTYNLCHDYQHVCNDNVRDNKKPRDNVH